MKRLVALFLLCAYPSLVFADTIYFKNGQTIEGELIDYKKNITFRIPDPKFDISWTFPAGGMVLQHSKTPKGSIMLIIKLSYLAKNTYLWLMLKIK